MATVIESLRDEITDNARGLVWSAALVAALGDPKEWEYTGDVAHDPSGRAHCSCGHPIMDIFIIRHKVSRRTAQLGSTCINYFEGAGEVFASLQAADKKLTAQFNEAKKAAKRAADEAKVAEARAQYEAAHQAMRDRMRAFRERGQMAPRALWAACESSYYRIPSRAPEYQRPCDYLKWYAKQSAAIAVAMS
jgi:hypothetical protein